MHYLGRAFASNHRGAKRGRLKGVRMAFFRKARGRELWRARGWNRSMRAAHGNTVVDPAEAEGREGTESDESSVPVLAWKRRRRGRVEDVEEEGGGERSYVR